MDLLLIKADNWKPGTNRKLSIYTVKEHVIARSHHPKCRVHINVIMKHELFLIVVLT